MQIKFENIKDKCPICEKNMKVYIGNTVMESQSCSNKCYQMIKGLYGTINCWIFEEHYCIKPYYDDRKKEIIKKQIENSILFYKENDRYLSKILGV